MASPVAEENASTVNSTDNASCQVSKPANTVDGDLLVAILIRAITTATITGPTGWTKEEDQAHDGGDTTVWYKVAGGSEPADYTWSWTGNTKNIGAILRITGADTTTPIAASPTPATGSSALPDPPSADPGSSDDYLAVAFVGMEGKRSPFTESTGYTEEVDLGTSSGGAAATHSCGHIASKEYTGQVEDPGTVSSSGTDGWATMTLIIAPGGAGPQTITGSLLSRSPTFPTGAANPGNVNLGGVLFSKSGSFPAGSVNATNTLGGVLLSRSPTFPVGTVTPGPVTIDGVLLSRSPTFPTGAVNATNTITGILLSRSPTFPTGTVSSEIVVAGLLLSRPPTFPTGAANPGNVNIGGALLSRSPSFPIGVVSLAGGPQTITGILLSRSPTFPIGSVSSAITVSGVLLTRSPSFPTGSVLPGNVALSGVLLARSPTFPVGAVTSATVVSGILLTRSPTFPTGAVTPGGVTVSGILLARGPTFPQGAVLIVLGFQRVESGASLAASVGSASTASIVEGGQ